MLVDIPPLPHFMVHLGQASSSIPTFKCSSILCRGGSSILGTTSPSTHVAWSDGTWILECLSESAYRFTTILINAFFVVGILTITTRPLGRLGAAVGAAYNGLAAAVGLPAVPAGNNPPLAGQPGLAQRRAQALVEVRLRMQQHFDDALDPLAPVDQAFQAAQNRFQQQLRDANPRAHNANRALDAQGFEAEMDRINAVAEANRRRLQDLHHQLDELQRRRRPLRSPQQVAQPALPANNAVPGAWPAPRLGDLAADPFNPGAEAGAGVGGGLAFGGLDANRAVRNREMNNWFEEQLRNVQGR